ncbi:hypothetical protein niasHS_016726 [Heterodera schachtii]|uniref:Glutathione synthetase n=1 Tax=Heterodera schachtii TaxID=97005 RepID=A0ABD2HXQ3_HETSC
MRDHNFLSAVYRNLLKYDQHFRNAFQIVQQVHAEGIKQPYTVLFQRTDYMLCGKSADKQQNSDYVLRQLEVNGGAIGGISFSARTSALHRQILSKFGLDLSNAVEVQTNKGIVEALYRAWLKFGNPKAIVLMIFNDVPSSLYYERNSLFNDLILKFFGKAQIVSLTLAECSAFLTLDPNDFSLRFGDKIIAVVFNQQMMISANQAEMEARRMIERSTAIKAPSLAAALAHTKKVQQVLAKPGILEYFFKNPNEAPLIEPIRSLFTKIWRIDDENTQYNQELIEKVKQQPNQFVLKKIEYAFTEKLVGRTYFGQEILSRLSSFTAAERASYILMEKLQPITVKNHMVWPRKKPQQLLQDEEHENHQSFFEEVTPELGIFGTLFGNVVNGQVFYNVPLGHLLKTKLANENEGGVIRGNSAYDSAYLVD